MIGMSQASANSSPGEPNFPQLSKPNPFHRSTGNPDASTPLLDNSPPRPTSVNTHGAMSRPINSGSPSGPGGDSQGLQSSFNPFAAGGFALQQHTEVEKNKLGTINGCYVPCLLNIMGIVLFERLAWGIGQQGVSGVLLSLFCLFPHRHCPVH